MEFPRLVYKSPSVYKLVHDSVEFDLAIGDGWFASVPEAMAPKQPNEAADTAPATRAELEAKATELGLKFDGRTSDRKLSDLIDEAIKG